MIALASELLMGVGRFSKPRGGVGVLAMRNARLDVTQLVQYRC